jgi:purine-cytosine permease-like protein
MTFQLHIDIFKGLTFLWVIFLMNYFQNYTHSMWLYLFLNGSYGICWLIKDLKFPDAKVTKPASVGSHLILFFLLISYWMIPIPLAAGYGLTHPSPARVVFLVVLYLTGVFLMMGSDYQKNTRLLKKKGMNHVTKASFPMASSNTRGIQTT